MLIKNMLYSDYYISAPLYVVISGEDLKRLSFREINEKEGMESWFDNQKNLCEYLEAAGAQQLSKYGESILYDCCLLLWITATG